MIARGEQWRFVVRPADAAAPRPPVDLSTRQGERRASVRFPCRWDATCRQPSAAGNEACVRARARDISTGGVSVIVPQWFGRGTLLWIDLHDGPRERSRSVLARVMHATLQPDGTWFVGC